jgi:4-methyl-5(b-hydroxyethyl)-thiazole monophosphate biosynthesis
MKKICVHLAKGFEEIEAVSIIDVLRRAGLKVLSVSVTGEQVVYGAHDIPIVSDILFEELDYENDVEMIVLPGGIPGAINLREHEGLCSQILNFHDSGKPLAAICAAPLVLGELGLLKDKKAVCYPGFEKHLKGAIVGNEPAVKSGSIITGRGVGTALDFSLQIVEMLKGIEMADKLKAQMLIT